MTFFIDDQPRPVASSRWSRRGWLLLIVAVIGTVALAWVPTPYVIEQPGTTFDTLGDVVIDGQTEPMIVIPDETVYPTSGSLTLLTVGVVGSRQTPVSWLDVAAAWFDPSKAVIPVDVAYPQGQTIDESNEANANLMQQSQQAAAAAALTELGYDVPNTVVVRGTLRDSPADGELLPGDELISGNGKVITDIVGLQSLVASNGVSKRIQFKVLRDEEELEVALTPVAGIASDPVIGVSVDSHFELPFDVQIRLEDVGGPSAGMMFALGIVDKLTPGSLTGGEDVAGTGTLSGTGEVGPIGGIRQKLYGALNAGADWFLAPEKNCDEVVGHIPDGLRVFSVSTLDDAIAALDGIESGDTDSLKTCAG